MSLVEHDYTIAIFKQPLAMSIALSTCVGCTIPVESRKEANGLHAEYLDVLIAAQNVSESTEERFNAIAPRVVGGHKFNSRCRRFLCRNFCQFVEEENELPSRGPQILKSGFQRLFALGY